MSGLGVKLGWVASSEGNIWVLVAVLDTLQRESKEWTGGPSLRGEASRKSRGCFEEGETQEHRGMEGR